MGSRGVAVTWEKDLERVAEGKGDSYKSEQWQESMMAPQSLRGYILVSEWCGETSLVNRSTSLLPETSRVNVSGLTVEFLSRAGLWLRKVLVCNQVSLRDQCAPSDWLTVATKPVTCLL